jgi:hypothetical protein
MRIIIVKLKEMVLNYSELVDFVNIQKSVSQLKKHVGTPTQKITVTVVWYILQELECIKYRQNPL